MISPETNQKIPNFSILDIREKLTLASIYYRPLALKIFIEDVEFIVRTLLFATGILTIFTITKRTLSNNVEFALLSSLLVGASYFALKMIPLAWTDPQTDIVNSFAATFMQTIPKSLPIGIAITIASVSLYHWNQER